MMQNIKKALTEDQRLVILRCLSKCPGYSANDSILDDILEQFGHRTSRDLVRTHIRWLEEQGLLSVEMAGNTLTAQITQRGIDVATGDSVVDGVKRPAPGA